MSAESEPRGVSDTTTTVRNARCLDCGHVGDRAFNRDEHGYWRDVLGGATGLRADHCICSRCEGERFEMVPTGLGKG